VRSSLVLVLAAACSSNPTKTPDAAPDVTFTGEYVDWDSTDNVFCGIFNATWTVRGDATRTDKSNPNGRFMLVVPGGVVSLVDITPDTADSQCLTPTSHYTVPGIAVADPAVIATGQMLSTRDFTVARAATLGVTLDPAKGHVFVHVDGTQAPVSVSPAGDAPQRFDGSAWGPGSTGVNVFFPNVPVGTPDVLLEGGGVSVTGGGSVPVEAGKITYVTLVGS
jgi:hypothetical protein